MGDVLHEDLRARSVVLVLVRPDGGVLDRVPETGDEVRVDIGPCDPEGDQADLRADGVEGIGNELQALLDGLREKRLGEERRVRRAVGQRGEHVQETGRS